LEASHADLSAVSYSIKAFLPPRPSDLSVALSGLMTEIASPNSFIVSLIEAIHSGLVMDMALPLLLL
jgi:hypothetical protein